MVWWDERTRSPTAQQAAPQHPELLLHATVDLDCGYTRALVLEAFRRRPQWRVTCTERRPEDDEGGPDEERLNSCAAASTSSRVLHWGEYERIDWEAVHRGAQWASCYCVRKGLIRKAHLAHNCKKWAAKHPRGRLAAAVPETLLLELDDVDYIDEALADAYEVRDMADGSAVWIAKPSVTNQALGICVFDRVATLRAALAAAEGMREWVLQRYIERPLLVRGRKFHVRAYMLCVGALSVYVYSDALALFTGEPYDRADLGNLAAHLTNTCALRRASSSGAAANEQLWDEDGAVKLLSELPEMLAEEGMPTEVAQQRLAQATADMHAILGECLEAVSGELTFFTLPNAFELFGFDLLLDADWRMWMLEANAEPDLQQTGGRLRGLIAGLIGGALELVAGPLERQHGLQNGRQQNGQTCACTESPVHTAQVEGFGRWVKVYEKRQEGRGLGGSGLQML